MQRLAEYWLEQHVPTGQVAIDVGANKGEWTRFLAERFHTVHAFEPNPQVNNPDAERVAIGDVVGTLRLYLDENSELASAHPRMVRWVDDRKPVGAVTVPVTTLDHLGFPTVDFVKVDTEGHEMAVLRGARMTLERCHPKMIVEAHSVRQRKEIRAFLRRLGYRLCFTEGAERMKEHSYVVAEV